MRAVRFFDGAVVREGTLRLAPRALPGQVPELVERPAPAGTPRLNGLITGPFTDHHVHLQLVDHTLLAGSRLGAVVDLGADLDWIADLAEAAAVHNSSKVSAEGGDHRRHSATDQESAELRTPTIRYAGPFLTAPGGYPSDRAWAPAGSACEIVRPEQASAVVARLAAAGAAIIKVVAHSEAGPVLDDETFRAIVRSAAAHRLPVVAHAEGPGQAQRVVRLGAGRLAHAPFSERLTDSEIVEQAANASWISTLAIHDGATLEIAVDNVRRFAAAGGEVLYGTDMGNGPTPVDLSETEIEALRSAGIDGLDLLATLAPADPLTPGTPLLLLPGDDPAQARRLLPADLLPPDQTPTQTGVQT